MSDLSKSVDCSVVPDDGDHISRSSPVCQTTSGDSAECCGPEVDRHSDRKCGGGCGDGSSGDSDSHCCVCCNCNRGKQKMRKELIRERLRKKLKLRKLRNETGNSAENQEQIRARKMLLQRLQHARRKYKNKNHSTLSIQHSQAEVETLLGEGVSDDTSGSASGDFPASSIEDLKSLLRSKSEELIQNFLCLNFPNSPSRSSPSIPEKETTTSGSGSTSGSDDDEDAEDEEEEEDEEYDFEETEESINFIFEPNFLESLDPIEKEIEEFKLFCQVCVPARPRLKVPLVTLNLMS